MVDIIAQGITLTITFGQDFTYTVTDVDPGPPEVIETENGTFTVIGGAITFTPTDMSADAPLTIDVLTSTDLTLSNANDSFDFNDDGTETPASLVAIFVKQ